MKTIKPASAINDENPSIRIIREMIKVSQKKLRRDSILFVIWGWVFTISNIFNFISGKAVLTHLLKKTMSYLSYATGIVALAFTIYYIYRQRMKVQTYIGTSIRYIWIAMIFCMVFINLIQGNVLHKIVFELQHPVFMIVIAFTIFSTGAILRYRLIMAGGILFAIIAYLASYLTLNNQLLAEAAAWFSAFVIPGHILYAKRNS
jgi:hypothetical protein